MHFLILDAIIFPSNLLHQSSSSLYEIKYEILLNLTSCLFLQTKWMSLAYTRLENILSQKRNDKSTLQESLSKYQRVMEYTLVGNGIVERGDDTPQTSVKSSQH